MFIVIVPVIDNGNDNILANYPKRVKPQFLEIFFTRELLKKKVAHIYKY